MNYSFLLVIGGGIYIGVVLYFKYLIQILDLIAHGVAHLIIRFCPYRMNIVDMNLKLVFPANTVERNTEIKFKSTKLAVLNGLLALHQRFLIYEATWMTNLIQDTSHMNFTKFYQDYEKHKILLLLPHYGTFYNMTTLFNVFQVPTVITYKIDYKFIEKILFQCHTFKDKIFGVNQTAFKSYIKDLNRGTPSDLTHFVSSKNIIVLCDQKSNKKNLVKFLNQWTPFHTTPVDIHKITGHSLWVTFLKYDFQAKKIHHEVVPIQSERDDTDPLILVQRIADVFSAKILADPEQYYWLHNRFNLNFNLK
jgi:lauroyl/myristoyl acyltransferase